MRAVAQRCGGTLVNRPSYPCGGARSGPMPPHWQIALHPIGSKASSAVADVARQVAVQMWPDMSRCRCGRAQSALPPWSVQIALGQSPRRAVCTSTGSPAPLMNRQIPRASSHPRSVSDHPPGPPAVKAMYITQHAAQKLQCTSTAGRSGGTVCTLDVSIACHLLASVHFPSLCSLCQDCPRPPEQEAHLERQHRPLRD